MEKVHGWNNPFFVKQTESKESNGKLKFILTWVFLYLLQDMIIERQRKKSKQQSYIKSIYNAKNSKPNTMAYEGDSIRKHRI